jgi:hypothetical protein
LKLHILSAGFIAGDQQRDISTRSHRARKKVATEAKIEIKSPLNAKEGRDKSTLPA